MGGMGDFTVRIGPDVTLSGPLRIEIPCRTSTSGPPGRHPATINTDWSVDTGHDLDAERIARVLGGSTSCLGIAERAAAGLHLIAQFHARRRIANASYSQATESWALTLPGHGRIPTTTGIAQLTRDPSLFSTMLDLDHGAFRALAATVATAVTAGPRPLPGADRLVCGRDPLETLWYAGIHPGFVHAAHAALRPVDGRPFSAELYVALAYHRPRLDYVRNVLLATDQPSDWLWAITTERAEDRRHPHARADLLAEGVGRGKLRTLVQHCYTVAEIRELAEGSGVRPGVAIARLHSWVKGGCVPRPRDLLALDAVFGHVVRPPTKREIDDALDRTALNHMSFAHHQTRLGLLETVRREVGPPSPGGDRAEIASYADRFHGALDRLGWQAIRPPRPDH